MKRSALLVFVIAVTSICSGQWLERQVVIGDTLGGIGLISAGGIVVNPVSGNVYIESGPIQIFNPATQEKLRGPGATGKVAFCPTSGKGYVLCEESLLVLDASADTVISTTVLPFEPYIHAYSPTSNRLYLGEENEETLLVFDPDGDSVLRSVAVGDRVSSLLWDSVLNRVYVGTSSDSTPLKVLDCATDSFFESIQLGSGRIRSLVLSYASRKLYCCSGIDVHVVSTDSLKSLGIVPRLYLPSEDRFTYSPVTDRLYWGNGVMTDTVAVIDCQGDTIRAQFEASVPVLAANSLNGIVYVGLGGSPQVLVVDTNDSVLDSVTLSTVPFHGVPALRFRPDRNELYGVTSYGDLAFIVDASVDTLSSTLNYAAYLPRQMLHNPAGNKLYLLCPGHDEILVMDSTFGPPKHIGGGATGTYALPVLNPTLNQLYVADADWLRVIDCNRDSLVRTALMTYYFDRPRAVLVPHLNKLYLFDSNGNGDNVFAYDALRDTLFVVTSVTDAVPAAVYDPRSNRVFFACEDAPSVRVLDPVTDSVIKAFDLAGGSSRGRFALNIDLGRLYYTDQSPNRMFTIDLLADSVIANESLPWDVDSMFLNRRLGKLFMCSRDTSQVLVLDCGQGTIVDTFDVGYDFVWGVMNDRNDKLYLSHGVVVDCRYDSVVTVLQPDTLTPRCMAWDAINNRVFQATTSWLYVYRDGPYGIEEQQPVVTRTMLTVLGNPVRNAVRLRLQIQHGQTGALTVFDAAGRRVHSSFGLRTSSFDLDLSKVPAGVYFVCLEVDRTRTTDKVVVQH
jgi:DNA-binding beta-propeller fold protein YncE